MDLRPGRNGGRRPAAGAVEPARARRWPCCCWRRATAALAFNPLRGHRDIDCGCGGAGRRGQGAGLSWWLVLRNAVLALWAAPALLAVADGSRGLQWVDAAAVFGLAMSAVGLYFTANHLLASHLKLRNL